MRTLEHHVAISDAIEAISARIAALQSNFSQVAQRTPVDDALIDLLTEQSQGLLQAAQALKMVDYTPPVPTEPIDSPGA